MINDLKEREEDIKKKISNREYNIIEEIDKTYKDALDSKVFDIALSCLSKKVYVHTITGQMLEANRVLKLADELSLSQNIDQLVLLDYYINKALSLSQQDKQSEAFNLYLKVLELGQELNDLPSITSASLQVGDHYFGLKNYDKAEKYLKDALANIKKSKGDKRAWLAYCKLGYTYLENKNNEKAKEVLLKSYEEADQIDHIIGKVLSLQNLGECELALGNKEKALELCEQALRLSNENVGLDHFNTSISLTKVMVLGELKEYQKMILILDDVSSKINVERMFLGLHEFYIKAYEGLEDYKSALKHQRLYTELKEKLYGFDLKKHSEELESKYQNKLKEREKEILRLQKVELEQKAIRAQLNPHFFFNALNSIQKFIVDNDEENATRYLQSFSGLMRKTLENSEEMFISLEDEIAYLKDYLTLEQLRCNNSFQFEFIIDEEIEDDFVKLPTMLLQPYVENAIKHGINGLKDGLVVINFCLDVNENLLCTIQDNGKGIKQKSKTVKHKSMATKLLQKRILALEEQFQVAFQINTLDLSEQNKSKTGTRVEVLIPQIEHAAK